MKNGTSEKWVHGSFTEYGHDDWRDFEDAMSESLSWLAKNHAMNQEQWEDEKIRRRLHAKTKLAAEELRRETEYQAPDRDVWPSRPHVQHKEKQEA